MTSALLVSATRTNLRIGNDSSTCNSLTFRIATIWSRVVKLSGRSSNDPRGYWEKVKASYARVTCCGRVVR
jgi:hypothetical protein